MTRHYTRDDDQSRYTDGYSFGVMESMRECRETIADQAKRLRLSDSALAQVLAALAECHRRLMEPEPNRTSPHHRTKQ